MILSLFPKLPNCFTVACVILYFTFYLGFTLILNFCSLTVLFSFLKLNCCSVVKLCLTFCDPMDCSTPGFAVLSSLLEFSKFMSIESMMPSSHLILCCLLLLLPSIFPSIRVFSNESALCIRWPKYSSFIFSISPSNQYSGLISFRIDWFDLFAVQGILKSLLQHTVQKHQFLTLLSLVYGPILTSTHNYWKNHSFHYMDFCWQSDVSAF